MGNNTNLVDYSYVGNVADAHLLAADCLAGPVSASNTVAGQVFFITDGKPRPYWDFPRLVFGLLGDDGKNITTLPYLLCVFMAFLSEVAARIFGGPPGFPMFIVKLATLEQYFNIDKVSITWDHFTEIITHSMIIGAGLTRVRTSCIFRGRRTPNGRSRFFNPRNQSIFADLIMCFSGGRNRENKNTSKCSNQRNFFATEVPPYIVMSARIFLCYKFIVHRR